MAARRTRAKAAEALRVDIPAQDAERLVTANQQAAEILAKAKERGVQSDFFFKTTFQRYLVQLRIMADLDEEIKKNGVTVKKEYVKGRRNVYTNPAVTEYNKTSTAANATVSTLINIIKSLTEEDPNGGGKLRSLMAQLASEADEADEVDEAD